MNAKTTKGFSLFIGLNGVNPLHYAGWNGYLQCCENDVKGVKEIADQEGYTNIETLLTKKATRKKVYNALQKAAELVNSNDTFLIYYSGHGSFIKDENSDEDDGQDETWCLYDGQMLDDEIYSFWNKFKNGVKILMISDSCHSGTMYKFRPDLKNEERNKLWKEFDKSKHMPEDVNEKVFLKNKEFYSSLLEQKKNRKETGKNILATVLSISACQDDEQARAGYFNSLFTRKLLDEYNNPNGSDNYKDFHLSIKEKIDQLQNPKYDTIGSKNEAFESQKPFKII